MKILTAYRVSKNIDLFKSFLEPAISKAYIHFRQIDLIKSLHEMLILEAAKQIEITKEDKSIPEPKYTGIITCDPVHTYHELKNKFEKASNKKISGDPYDQKIKALIKWDENYYYIKFIISGKIGSDILLELTQNFEFLEVFTYEYDDTGDRFENSLTFDILSSQRISEWIMEPIFKLPEGKEWAYQFNKTELDVSLKFFME